MSIGRKLYSSFGSILGILVLLILVSYLAIDREHSARSTGGVSLQEIQMIEAMRFQMMQNRLSLRNFLLSGDRRDEANELKGISQLSEMMKDAQSKTAFGQLRSTYASIETTERSWVEEFAKPLMDKRHQVDAGQATLVDLHATYLQRSPGNWVTTEVKELDESERMIRKELDGSDAAANTAAKVSAILLTIGTIFAALLGVFIAYRTSLSITQPLTHLTDKTRQVAETGDLDQKIEVLSNDEIGALAEHHRNMMAHVKEMAGITSSIAGGHLNVVVRPRSARDTMANALLQMLHGLRELVRKVRDSASQVASGAAQMAAASSETAKVSVDAASAIDEITSTMHEMSINTQNVVKSTQMQSSSVAETSASVDQMVASINRVADTARTLLEICQRSREEVDTGIQTMEKATRGLTRTSSAIQSSGQIIDVLGRRADEIGKIIEVIDDLAEQTNLLALNAAIEAARAGEHGLGFAVVAEEVRKLAEKSTQSTKEISDLIQGIQKEARQAVENMEKSTSMVQEGLDLGGELSSALGKISDVVSEVYQFAQQIGAATSEQSTGSTQIAKATTRLTEITQEINSTIEEQATGAQSVVRAMEKMRDLVQQSTSSSTQLAATAENMSKLSRGLLDSMDQFVTEENVKARSAPRAASRSTFGRERSSSAEQPELARV
jgi:methyl-accepting chemotaxis protein